MSLHEQNFNQIFGEVLREQFYSWRNGNVVRIESPGQLVGKRHQRPDVVVVPRGGYPVVFESAFEGTADLDGDARARIGMELERPRRPVMTSFVVVIPRHLRSQNDVAARAFLSADGVTLKYAIFMQGQGDAPDRFPAEGYAQGTPAQLASLAAICSVPGHIIDARMEQVYRDIERIAARMDAMLGDGARQRLADVLGIALPEAAMRVGVCIWLDSFLAQERLADVESKFAGVSQFVGVPDSRLRERVVRSWEEILEVNYAAIFTPTIDTLRELSGSVGRHLREILDVAQDVVEDSLHHVLDIGGELLPRLAPDRKATAAFYTLRESADLLTGLVPDSCYRGLAASRGKRGLVGDFACGTGSLLVSAYRRIRQHIDASGGDPDAQHRWWMEEGLFGVDIQPIAVHLTALRLSSFAMDRGYRRSNIIYAGLDGSGSTGALELLHQPVLHDLFHSKAGASQKDLHAPAADGKFGLCVMNPPYSRTRRGQSLFRVSQLDEKGRRASQKRHGELIKPTFASAQAGMASSFAALADKKLKHGGVYASVLPATAAASSSWQGFRQHLWEHYSDVVVVSLTGDGHQAFSADTNMNELLVVATKGNAKKSTFHFVSLYAYPRHAVETEAFTHVIRGVVDGAAGGQPTPLHVGGSVIGDHIACALASDELWAAACVRDLSLLGLMGRFHRHADMQKMSTAFDVGYTESMIGHLPGNDPRGAFEFHPNVAGVTSRRPSLWEKNHKIQRSVLVSPSHDGVPVAGREDLVRRVWDQRMHVFWGRNLRMTSQALCVAYTESPCMGGAAWTGLRPKQKWVDKALCLWANSIFGLVWSWLYGGKEQTGRSRRQVASIQDLRIPRFDAHALSVAEARFDELIRLPLRPCGYAHWDDNRKRIDQTVCDMLGFGKDLANDVAALRQRWCREPGVHGGKQELVGLLHADRLI